MKQDMFKEIGGSNLTCWKRTSEKEKVKKHSVLRKFMNLSFEEKYCFTHVSGELLIPRFIEYESLPTIVCILDKEKEYRYGIRIVGKSLCQKGFRVYCFNFDEKEREVIFREKVKCIGEIIKHLKKSKHTRNIVLLGINKGAAYAEAVASKMPELINAMIFYYPQFDENLYDEEFQEKCYQEEKDDYTSKFRGSVMVIHGKKDKVVEVQKSEKLLECYDNAVLNILPRESHEFTFWGRKKAVDLCCGFIEKIMN